MSPQFVRSKYTRAAFLAALAFAVACGSSDLGGDKLKALKTGDSKAKIASVIGTGPLTAITPADSMRLVQGYRIQQFVANGATHEILWYREAPGSLEDSLTAAVATPIVLVGDTLAGWGWSFFNKYAEKNGLPNPSRDVARMDSIAKSQMPAGKTP